MTTWRQRNESKVHVLSCLLIFILFFPEVLVLVAVVVTEAPKCCTNTGHQYIRSYFFTYQYRHATVDKNVELNNQPSLCSTSLRWRVPTSDLWSRGLMDTVRPVELHNVLVKLTLRYGLDIRSTAINIILYNFLKISFSREKRYVQFFFFLYK